MWRYFLLILMLAGAAVAADFNGEWDAIITSSSTRVPFRMQVAESPALVCLFEDTQPVCSTSAVIEAGRLTARWDYLNTEMHLAATGGVLAGDYVSLRSKRISPIEARHHQSQPAASQPPVKIGGDWEVHSKEHPAAESGQLILRQSGAELKGTILYVDGDEGTLTGRIDGAHFLISHFSGDRPTMLEGTLLADGTLDLKQNGQAIYALRPSEARARGLKPPPDPATFAKAKNPNEPFRFSFPDLNGRTVTQAAFAGKPYIVTITGSWCPNCRDEAPFLSDLYKRYHDSGLEIVGFCFESGDDPSNAPLRAFIRRYAIAYPMLLAGESAKLAEAVPQIDNLGAFPSTIYVGRDGRVRRVHTGFPSPGSGEERTRVEKEIRSFVEEMLREL